MLAIKLKRQYTSFEGDMLEFMKKKNPKYFYKTFAKKKGSKFYEAVT